MTERPPFTRRHVILATTTLVLVATAVTTVAWRRFERGLAEDEILLKSLGVARGAARLMEAGRGEVTPHLLAYGNEIGAKHPDVLRLVVIDTGRADAFGVRRGASTRYSLDGRVGLVADVDRPLVDRSNHLLERFTAANLDKPIPLAELVEVSDSEPDMLRVGALAPIVQNGVCIGIVGALLRVPAVEVPLQLGGLWIGALAVMLFAFALWSDRRPGVSLLFALLAFAVMGTIAIGLRLQDAVRDHLATRATDWLAIQAAADVIEPVALVAPVPGRERWSHDGALRLERDNVADSLRVESTVGSERTRLGYAVARTHPDASASTFEIFDFDVLIWALIASVLMGLTALPLARLYANMVRDPSVYLYVSPAVLGLIVLVVTPFVTGIGLAFYHYQLEGDAYTFVGLGNFRELVAPSDTADIHFWRTLGVTILWTVSNVVLHVAIGLGLALLLNRPGLTGRRIYRVLLVLPWAVPSYITALLWRSMFLGDHGPVNRALGVIGLEPIRWFDDHFWTNFVPNLVTNTWLGFPFMMVVALGALQSIPADLYEAADLDGASAWQRFRHVTLPLLRPALLPAIILGTIWTFNLFNVIYLVSMGAGGTEILITEAYRTFHEQHRHGYAAAYSVMIFLVLLGYTWVTSRVTRAAEGAVS